MSEEDGYHTAIKVLDKLFYQPHKTIRGVVKDIPAKTAELSGTSEDLSKLSIKLRSCYTVSTEMECESEMDSIRTLESLVTRLPRRLQRMWAEVADGIVSSAGRYQFIDFIEMIEESRI
ncbi:unnamed protein product [Echinostoma caproni]|uniref:GLOBIN domain-containing protein n=1 Tax=Echinostoma caproni TaxID=27848 RepID=A0A183AXX0_9TREM|nr:unnamed protein product [Echinostoma caproni]